jgi:dynein light chain Tctex-type 1
VTTHLLPHQQKSVTQQKMEGGYQDDAAEFSVEDVEGIVRTSIHNSLNEHSYNPKKVNEWTNLIVTNCLKDLQQLNRPFKYVITCIIMQKNGAGLCTSSSMFWDTNDGLCKVPWQNLTMHCIVTVYGVSVNIDDSQDMDM